MTGIYIPYQNGINLQNQSGIIGSVDPSPNDPSALVTVNFLKNYTEGLKDPKDAVFSASDTNLAGLYNSTTKVLTASVNGVLSIDGVNPPLGSRILLFGQSTGSQNGIFDVTNPGSAGTPFSLTRSADFNRSDYITNGAYFWCSFGNTYANTQFLLVTNDPITLDTTSLNFTPINALNNLSVLQPLVKTGNQLSLNIDSATLQVSSGALKISSGYVGQTSITTLGTITTGTWNGSIIPIAFGGTGANSISQAKTNFGWASSGANSDITSLSGLTTALSISQGGTGGATPAQARTNLGVFGKTPFTVSSGITTINLTHNLGTTDITEPFIFDTVTKDKLYNVGINVLDANTISLNFGTALVNPARVVLGG